MEVYCKDCRYLICYFDIGGVSPNCTYPDNSIKVISANWYNKKEKEGYKELPEIINKNNDCNWYKKETSKILLLMKGIIRAHVNM